MSKSQSDAILWGYYGHYNLGDEAMLAGMLQLLRQWRPGLEVTVYSHHPEDTAQRHGVATLTAVPPRRQLERGQQWWEKHRQLLRHPYFVLGGGDLLRDGPERSVAEVWLQPLARAIALRRKTLIWGVSVGDLWRPSTQALIPKVLNRTDLIVVRDHPSQAKLAELGVSQPIYVMPDLALFALAQDLPADTFPARPRIGVSFRSLTQRPQIPGGLDPDQFARTMAAVLDTLVESMQADLHLLPFQAFPAVYRERHRPAVDDYRSILEMLAYSQHAAQITVHTYIPSLDELLNTLSTMDVVIGTRLHAVILATGLGVPAIAIAYDPKVTHFMAEIQQSDWVIPLSEFGPDSVLNKVTRLLAQLPAARSQVQQGIQQYRQKMTLAEAALKSFWQA